MADHHRSRADEKLVPQMLLEDDPQFLHWIMERPLHACPGSRGHTAT
jgi:hypothetical protein